MESKRTQPARSAATRAALVTAARPLFAERGYAGVGTDEIARAAGVSRGALYHQFAGKEELFAAVYEQVEAELTAEIDVAFADAFDAGPMVAVQAGIDAWLRASMNPEVQRIVLIEAPAALGWERWREIGRRYAVGLVEGAVSGLISAGVFEPQPVTPLAHLLVGALEEGTLYAARAEDREQALREVGAALLRLFEGLAVRT
ncbi:TetR/AcrR family transcriptional regulator [Nocardioides conyzicola]|uniref:TetR/AcrR family transcriptional regulator n=1 Tax=Nocardioides conyzicola TaxID=1651781 RepID=A0ABP8WIU8_9ACTN